MSGNEMGISEAGLRAATRDLDDLHRETFPAVRGHVEQIIDYNRGLLSRAGGAAASRRGVLVGGLTLVGGVALAACGSSTTGSSGTAASTPSASASTSPYTGDLRVVALAAALENLAVAAYTGALKKATAGDYGTVPPAVAQFVTTAMKQHVDHAQAWNAVLTGAKLPAVTNAPLTITTDQVAKLNATKTVAEVATLALGLENAAAQTYTFAVANVTNAGGISTAATIAPVEAMHAAILSFVIGQYPVPDAYIGVSNAVKPSALTV